MLKGAGQVPRIYFIRLREEKGQPRSIAFEVEAVSVEDLTRQLGRSPSGIYGKRISWRRADPDDSRSRRIITRRSDLTLTAARVEQIEEPLEPFLEDDNGGRSAAQPQHDPGAG